MTNINDILLMWDQQEASLQDTFADHIDRSRAQQIFAQARSIAADLAAVEAKVRSEPHQDGRIDEAILAQAQEAARARLKPLTTIIDRLQSEAAASAELPQSVTKGTDPATVAAIRARLISMDPVEVFATYQTAAATSDAATLEAINNAHHVAFPSVGKMFAANPGVRAEAATQVRANNDPNARRVIEGKQTLTASLTAVVGDLQRAAGADNFAITPMVEA